MDVRQTKVFGDWLIALRDRRAAARIVERIDRLRLGGLGEARPVGEGVSELRLHYGPGYRIYFIRRGESLVVLLCGGDKGSQDSDVSVAKRLARDL